MASQGMTLPPPPGAGDDPSQNDQNSGASAAPGDGSPAPPQPSPMSHGTSMLIRVVQDLRAIAKAYPSTAPKIAQINDLMREVGMAMMQHQSPGESQAPPVNS